MKLHLAGQQAYANMVDLLIPSLLIVYPNSANICKYQQGVIHGKEGAAYECETEPKRSQFTHYNTNCLSTHSPRIFSVVWERNPCTTVMCNPLCYTVQRNNRISKVRCSQSVVCKDKVFLQVKSLYCLKVVSLVQNMAGKNNSFTE